MPLMSKPLIGIVGEVSAEHERAVHLPLRYAEAIERAGGVPFAVTPLPGDTYREALIEATDGLLFAGGDDFDTELIGLGPTHPAARPVPREKQEFDFALARGTLEAGVPCLGICYGMQCFGLVEGAGIYQHLPEDRPASQAHSGGVVHAVRLVPGTKLASLLGVASCEVVSRHHQALSSVGPRWTIAGVDEQGLIEAIERADHPFALGVQWHPELSPNPKLHAALFRGLVEAASEGRSAQRRRIPEAVER